MINELRNKTGLSQQEFAKKFNIPVGTLRQWEQGRRKAPDYVYALLESALNTSIAERKTEKNVKISSTWENERHHRYIFPVVVGKQDFQIEKIHPLKQACVENIYKLLKDNINIEAVYIFGSSINLRCRPNSDIDIAILLKPDFNTWTIKGEIGEAVSKACDWKCDIVWLNGIEKKNQLYQGILDGEKII